MRENLKQSDVGLIPVDWICQDLTAFAEIIDGDRGENYPNADDLRQSGYCLFLNAGNVTKNGFKFQDCQFVSQEKDSKLRKGKLSRGDMVLTTRGTVGNFAYYDRSVPFDNVRINSGMVVLRLRGRDFLGNYLYSILQSNLVSRQIERIAFGSAQPQLTVKTISELKIPLSKNVLEQEAIANALSDADAYIESLEKLIEKKRLIKKGAMQELLAGKRRLPGFSGKWIVRKLGEIAKIQRGASPRPIDSPIWFDENSKVGWVRISDVTSAGMFLRTTTQQLSDLGIKNSRPVSRGSLIMSICATVGRPVITDIDCCIHDGFVVFDNLLIDRDYLYYFLSFIEVDWAKHGQTGSQMNLNTPMINATAIGVPIDISEQRAIAHFLGEMAEDIEMQVAKLSKARLIKQGMMQELLTGRIRLI